MNETDHRFVCEDWSCVFSRLAGLVGDITPRGGLLAPGGLPMGSFRNSPEILPESSGNSPGILGAMMGNCPHCSPTFLSDGAMYPHP